MLYLLVSPEPRVINLEFAAMVLFGFDLPPSKFKSALRRLTDFANILLTLQILKKVVAKDEDNRIRKSFQYAGPDIDEFMPTVDDLANLPKRREKYSYLGAIVPQGSAVESQIIPTEEINKAPIYHEKILQDDSATEQ